MRSLVLLALTVPACVDPRVLGGDAPWDGWPEGDALVSERVRIATWNVELLDQNDPVSWPAVLGTLRRLDADVIGLNEIDLEATDSVYALADELGFDVVRLPEADQFGEAANAILSRLDDVETVFPTAAELSGDRNASDMTRLPAVYTTTLPVTGQTITIVSQHFKSGITEADAFRRTVDAWRTRQAIAAYADSDMRIVMGDCNAELGEIPDGPPTFTALPADLPGSYRLGADMQAKVDATLVNDSFSPILDLGLTAVDAVQRDGDPATRPVSGRRLDYQFVNDAVLGAWLRSEVFDSRDEALPGIADGGEATSYNDSNHASDHLPVLIEIRLVAQ